MKFTFSVEVSVKNDAITQESDPHELAVILLNSLEENGLRGLPWVIGTNYSFEGGFSN